MQIFKDAVQMILSFSSDAIVIAILVALGTGFAFVMGKRRAISLILSFYPAVTIFRYLPFFTQFSASNPATSSAALIQIGIFLVILIPVYFVLNQFIASEFSYASHLKKITQSLILGTTLASLVVLISYHVVNLKTFYNFATGIDSLFAGNLFFWWLIAPFVVLFFLRD